MNLSKEIELASLLMDVESVLRGMGCWDMQSPAIEALSSVEPFCIDTLEFYQWLQWIFIPRLYDDLASGNPLPERCNIAPMGEQWGSMRAFSARDLVTILEKIDRLLTSQGQ